MSTIIEFVKLKNKPTSLVVMFEYSMTSITINIEDDITGKTFRDILNYSPYYKPDEFITYSFDMQWYRDIKLDELFPETEKFVRFSDNWNSSIQRVSWFDMEGKDLSVKQRIGWFKAEGIKLTGR